jgi:glutamate/tyrosine decarboxylase-like PLP-dependent enzyme
MPHNDDEIRRIGHLVVDLIADHLSSLQNEPVFRPVPADLAERIVSTPAPVDPATPDDILREFRDTIEPHPFGNGHPRFWGWVNSPPAVMGVFADALAAAMNPSCAGGNHGAIYVERAVIQWLREMLGFPASAMGLLVSGGSMATLTALGVARQVKSGVDVRAAGLRGAPQPFRFYQSSQGHSCARKAVELLGFGSDAIRIVPTTADYRIDPRGLDRAIAEDVAAGVRPIAVIATAGTVNTGAIDPIDAIADVCARHDVWLHVDAAYGGPAILTDEYRAQLTPVARADSIALDPHKWMFVPVEAGFVLIRDGEAMRSTYSLVPPYIRATGSSNAVMGLPWFSEYGFQQTRGFRALKVWMTMKQFGLAGHRRAIEENIALARYLADRIRQSPDLEVVSAGLSIVCFRYKVASEVSDTLNRRLLEQVQLGGEAFLTSTEIDGRFVLRACIVNYHSTRADIDRMIDAVRQAGVELTHQAGLPR